MPRLSLLVLCLAAVLGASPAQATHLSEADYDYPIHNPLRATLSLGVLKPLKGVPQPTYHSVKQPESIIPRYREARPVEYGFLAGKEGAPLVFLHCGLMASARESDKDIFRAQMLNRRGYQVVLLSSPLEPLVMANLLRSGLAGDIRADAAALYVLMERIAGDLRSRGVRWGRLYQVGSSMGGLHAAFVAEEDFRRRRLNFDKTLLLNPPVDVGFGIGVIDGFAGAVEDEGFLGAVAALLRALPKVLTYDNDEQRYSKEFFAQWNKELGYTDNEVKVLMSYNFKLTMPELNREARAFVERFKGNNPCYTHSDSKRFLDYLSSYVVPMVFGLTRKDCKPARRDEMTKTVLGRFSLTALTDFLRKPESRVHLFTNRDDFILRAGDLEYLEDTLGDRVLIFPYGGHSGGYWHPEYQRITEELLAP